MYISSDTNVWLDLSFINHIMDPFLLENEYYLSSITYHDEIDDKTNIIHNPINKKYYSDIRKCIKEEKIIITDASIDELKLAMEYRMLYEAISIEDAIALAIAKQRNWSLLTGDKQLRLAASAEKVACYGTLWIFDELLKNKKISKTEYLETMNNLLSAVDSKKRRLPRNEILKRMDKAFVSK